MTCALQPRSMKPVVSPAASARLADQRDHRGASLVALAARSWRNPIRGGETAFALPLRSARSSWPSPRGWRVTQNASPGSGRRTSAWWAGAVSPQRIRSRQRFWHRTSWDFLADHPGLSLDFLASTENVNFSRWEADIAVRLSRPETGRFRRVKAGRPLPLFV